MENSRVPGDWWTGRACRWRVPRGGWTGHGGHGARARAALMTSAEDARPVHELGWCFETDPAFAAELAWVEQFVTSEVEPLDHLIGHPLDLADPVRQRLIPPL